MRLIVFRLLAALLFSVLCAQLVAQWAGQTFFHGEVTSHNLQQVADLLEATPAGERLQVLDGMERTQGLRYDLVDPDHTRGRQTLRLSDGAMLRAHRHPPRPPLPMPMLQALFVVAFTAMVAVTTGRGLLDDLSRLEDTATAIAAGNYDTRVSITKGPVAPLAESFDHMATTVGDAIVRQRNLLIAVSHELRTPHARMQFLLESIEDSPPEKVPGLVSRMAEEMEEVDLLLREILLAARLESPPTTNAEPHKTAEVIEALTDKLQILSEEVKLTSTVTGTCPCSSEDLHRIVSNLVSNAMRHATTRVEVTVEADGQLVVSDDGQGVDPAIRASIFEPFVSGDPSRSRQLGGIGLGLTIAQRAAHRWNGEVSLLPKGRLGGASFAVRWS